jgi:spermidine synthase
MTHPRPSQTPNPWSFLPFALTIFTSAFLLFQVQPLLSKQILPWFGGSPAVWTTAMLFFQSLLCLGYLYAHALASLPSRKTQARIHVVLLVLAALLATRVLPGAELRPESPDSPVLQVLLILGASVGLPYFCLATTGPLVQHWFTSTPHSSSVFRLYALSNVGSLLALLSFPYVLEPWLEQQEMGRLWTAGFWVFALLCLPVAFGAWQNNSPAGAAHSDAVDGVPITQGSAASVLKPSLTLRMSWVALPALASLVFIATTDQISHDVAPEPGLWVATLSLYLITFILTFDHPRWYRPKLFAFLTLVLLIASSGLSDIPSWLGIQWESGVNEVRWSHYALLFVVCMLCHGELYRRRPVDTRRLTEFYLCMSIGGAFGGLFVTLVATQFFDDYYEWLMALILVALLACHVLFRAGRQAPGRVRPTVGALTAVVIVVSLFVMENPRSWRDVHKGDDTEVLLDQVRNFYGTVTVKERRFASEPERNDRVFFSGNVTHGQQFLSDALRHVPTTYYARDSGIGEALQWAMTQKPSLSVALIGLGAGTLANYARPADAYDFYEINPAAVRIAQEWFDNLSTCKAGEQNILLGDARLRMEQLPKDKLYDVIVLDAFTGGSVPIHLLTREAFQIYRDHLKPDGHIAINITNAYLNLYPIVKAQAEVLGMAHRHKYQNMDEVRKVRRNLHFIMTHDQAYLKAHSSVSREVRDDQGHLLRYEPYDQPGLRLWTDQFSSIAPIVR